MCCNASTRGSPARIKPETSDLQAPTDGPAVDSVWWFLLECNHRKFQVQKRHCCPRLGWVVRRRVDPPPAMWLSGYRVVGRQTMIDYSQEVELRRLVAHFRPRLLDWDWSEVAFGPLSLMSRLRCCRYPLSDVQTSLSGPSLYRDGLDAWRPPDFEKVPRCLVPGTVIVAECNDFWHRRYNVVSPRRHHNGRA